MSKKALKPFILFLIILCGWAVYRYFFRYPEWVDEFIAKPFIYFTPTVVFLLSERQPLSSIGFSKKKFIRNLTIGLLAGLFLAGESLMTRRFKYGSLTFNPEQLSTLLLIGNYFISLATGFTEEVVFRGFIQTRLQAALRSAYVSVLVSSALFVIVHLPLIIFVLHYSFFDTLTYCFLLFILGTLNGVIFTYTKSLVAPTITHSVWNFSSVLFK